MRSELKKAVLPINNNLPSGEKLDQMTEFYILEELVNGEAETQFSEYVPPDWKEVKKLSLQLLGIGKNLWVSVYLSYALVNIYGLAGVKESIEVTKELVEKYWDSIQPELDDETEEDYTLSRLAPLLTLSSRAGTFVNSIMDVSLFKTIHMGEFSFNDLLRIENGDTSDDSRLSNISITAISCDVRIESISSAIALISDSILMLESLDEFISEKIGFENNVAKLSMLVKILSNILNFLTENFSKEEIKSEINEEDNDLNINPLTDKNASTSFELTTGKTSAIITSQDDVIRLCNEICSWYSEYEPSSPVPYFIRRAKSLIGREFMDIISNLADESSERLSYLFGIGYNKPDNNPVGKYDDEDY